MANIRTTVKNLNFMYNFAIHFYITTFTLSKIESVLMYTLWNMGVVRETAIPVHYINY